MEPGRKTSGWEEDVINISVLDLATGVTTFVADGFVDDWLDDHTLIIQDVGRGPGRETE